MNSLFFWMNRVALFGRNTQYILIYRILYKCNYRLQGLLNYLRSITYS